MSPAAALHAATCLDDCNLTWNSPSADSFGSMPLGNGDVGANVWVEPNGDLLFYVSKVDAYDAEHLLPKLGRVRLRLSPPLTVDDFQQTLVLRDGAIAIRAGDVNLRVWVDANQPVIRVTGNEQDAGRCGGELRDPARTARSRTIEPTGWRGVIGTLRRPGWTASARRTRRSSPPRSPTRS